MVLCQSRRYSFDFRTVAAALAVLLVSHAWPLALTSQGTVFGPVTVVVPRGTVSARHQFQATPGTALLCVDNRGTAGIYLPVTSAWITLNGTAVFRPNDFRPQTTRLARQVSLASFNTLDLVVNGRPNSGLTVWIDGGASCAGGGGSGNTAPVANAGGDRQVSVGAQVTLDGSGSMDPDGDQLTFTWTLTSKPSGSQAALVNPQSPTPTLTPDVAGSYQVRLVVNDGQLDSAPDFVTITASVSQANRAPVITSVPVTTATLLAPYAYGVDASDADGDALLYELTVAPLGMSIDPAAGLITWLPPGTGLLDVTVRVDDGRGGVATQAFTIAVGTAPNRPPQFRPVPDRSIPLGRPFQLRLAADDPDPGDTLTFSLLTGPAGAGVDPAGPLHWTPGPGQLGSHTVTAAVSDSSGATDTATFLVTVVDMPLPPVLDPQGESVVTAGMTLTRSITAVDPNPGDLLTFGLVSGPAGLTVSPGGLLAWTPGTVAVGRHQVKVMVSDQTGLSDAAAFDVVVEVAPVALPPFARDDRYAVRRNGVLNVPAPGVLSNDLDPSNLPLTASLGTPPVKGTLDFLSGGGFSYTPAAPVTGSTEPHQAVTFSYAEGATAYQYVYTQPVVADLNGDGIPEVVFMAWGTFAQRRLFAVRGDTGALVFARDVYQPAATPKIMLSGGVAGTSSTLAVGDLDGDGKLEILAIHSDDETTALRRRIVAFNFDGTYRWTSADIVDGTIVTSTTGMLKLTLADLDGDGTPEILSVHQTGSVPRKDAVTVFNADGSIRWTTIVDGPASNHSLAVADIDLDGHPDIVIGRAVLSHQGVVKWNVTVGADSVWDLALANLDDDPFPEIVYVDRFGQLTAREHTGALKWGPVSRTNYDTWGHLTIGDVDGDGLPEILLARDHINGIIEVRNRSGVLVRELSVPGYDTLGHGGNTTIFDLNGDGRPEILYQGARGPFDSGFTIGALYVFDGPTGALLHSVQATRASRINADTGPLVVDVDGDGSAEIVTGGADDTVLMRVFKAKTGTWARTRPVWNQFGYHVTNVEPDGTIPAHAVANWLTPGLNNYRVNQPMPGEPSSDVDQFTYQASNGTALSNVATVTIDILPPNTAPRIVSVAPAAASPGVEYVYGVRALDPDVGEVLTYSLLQGPAGMTIVSGTGLVRWTPPPGASGTVQAIVRVTDLQSQTDSQMFFITVGPPVTVPDVLQQPLTTAVAALEAAGLAGGEVTYSPSGTVPAGSVLSQEPAAGALAAAGTAVALVVSSGPVAVSVPNVTGDPESLARQKLTFAGFGVTVTRVFSNTVPDGYVVSQTPAAGTALVPGSVALTVSAGSGLVVRLQRSVIPAGGSIGVTVVAHDLAYVEGPAGAVTFTVAPAMAPSFGPTPTVAGGFIQTNALTRGAFRITATETGTGRSATAEFGVTHPDPPGQTSMTQVLGQLTEAFEDIDQLARQGRTALIAGDVTTMRTLLGQMVQRWSQIDTREVMLTTPFGLAQGFFPAPSDTAAFGLTSTPDDLIALNVYRDAAADLEAWIQGHLEPTTSMAQLQALALAFRSRAGRIDGLTLSEWGVIRAQPYMTAIVTDRLPRLYSALMADLAVVVANGEQPVPPDADDIEAGPSGGIDSTLAEQVVTMAMQFIVDQIMDVLLEPYRSAKKFATDILKQAAFGAAVVAAASHIKSFMGAENITAVVSGASLSFHVFNAPWSLIEGSVDVDHPSSNVVVTIGPSLIDAVTELVEKVKEAFGAVSGVGAAESANGLFKALNGLRQKIKDLKDAAGGLVTAVDNAFQTGAEGMRGCIFTTLPTCGQLYYPNGFKSVYEYTPPPGFQSFSGLPAPILFLVYNKNAGGLLIGTPVFLPTKK